MTPPIVQAISHAGSGPSFVPCRARRALTARSVAPGPVRTRLPPSSTSIERKCRLVSASTPEVPAWPLRLVPPDLNVSGTPAEAQAASSAATLPADAGVATATGVSR